ncbi:hypothetical protein SOASR030_04260 [Leminorella grimontii]|uniref:Porin n=1 Tax=Leminorella grimontii TaxID=82981 RepID=A0AAV5MZU5_9GAMM|nr:YfaZ family outer membrane protein [Leminorella grimontii]KFC96488.1 YfaZ family protein [Leminorella grimontii ATCC 33999 = DSM 5078]GKX54314.1 hypothetical protein SOASR030_04260 [Leminorella grimontii]GKX57755.1 hypothetical protein SOASR031_00700 [Leminorella grimontii]VFS59548.1 outer membrane protein [Leminorella grimontii]
MKKSLCRLAVGVALFTSASAMAISVNGQVGEDYSNLQVGMGTDSTGLYSTVDWTHNDDNGDIVGLGLGVGLPLGPMTISVGGKGMYLRSKDHSEDSDDYAAAVGGGLRLPIGKRFSLQGSAYYAPDSLSSGINSYSELTGGVRWDILRPFSVEAGYRYVNLEGKDGNRDNAIVDGPYVGGSVHF